jgi:hypothetical protein
MSSRSYRVAVSDDCYLVGPIEDINLRTNTRTENEQLAAIKDNYWGSEAQRIGMDLR